MLPSAPANAMQLKIFRMTVITRKTDVSVKFGTSSQILCAVTSTAAHIRTAVKFRTERKGCVDASIGSEGLNARAASYSPAPPRVHICSSHAKMQS